MKFLTEEDEGIIMGYYPEMIRLALAYRTKCGDYHYIWWCASTKDEFIVRRVRAVRLTNYFNSLDKLEQKEG